MDPGVRKLWSDLRIVVEDLWRAFWHLAPRSSECDLQKPNQVELD